MIKMMSNNQSQINKKIHNYKYNQLKKFMTKYKSFKLLNSHLSYIFINYFVIKYLKIMKLNYKEKHYNFHKMIQIL